MDRKVALVTGAGRGIGRAVAVALAERGCNVAVNYNSSEAAALETVSAVKNYGVEAAAFKADVSNISEVKEMFKSIASQLGTVDILVCNAGITRDNLLMRMKDDEWERVISTNLNSLFYCAKEAVRPMMKNRWGRIVAVSSIVGLHGQAGQCNYAAAKAGIIGFVKSLAREVASRGITVNAVAPGFIETDMTAGLNDELKNKILSGIPAARAGLPEDVAAAAAFLASDAAGYVQGQIITVDGGLSM